jgi:hypothetical protein
MYRARRKFSRRSAMLLIRPSPPRGVRRIWPSLPAPPAGADCARGKTRAAAGSVEPTTSFCSGTRTLLDGSFVAAKKEATLWEKPSAGRGQSGWYSSMARAGSLRPATAREWRFLMGDGQPKRVGASRVHRRAALGEGAGDAIAYTCAGVGAGDAVGLDRAVVVVNDIQEAAHTG